MDRKEIEAVRVVMGHYLVFGRDSTANFGGDALGGSGTFSPL